MVGQADREQPRAGPLGADEQRHQQADATAVHVLHGPEVEDNRAGAVIQ